MSDPQLLLVDLVVLVFFLAGMAGFRRPESARGGTLLVAIALLCGLALDWTYDLIYSGKGQEHFYSIAQSTMGSHVHPAFSWLQTAASIVLLLVVLNALRLLWLVKRAKRTCVCHDQRS